MNENTGKQDNLRFNGVKFFSVHFEIIGPAKEETADIELDIIPKVAFNKSSETKFDVIYNVELSVEDVFTMSLQCVGYFELGKDILDNPNIKDQLVNANAPAIVFPYIRSFIAMFSANLGTVPTLTLPTHFFKGKLEEYQE